MTPKITELLDRIEALQEESQSLAELRNLLERDATPPAAG